MTGKRHWRETDGGARGTPTPAGRGQRGLVSRVGAPALIALASALGILALLFCALFVPGFVLPADAGTTSSTLNAPATFPNPRPIPPTTDDAPTEPAAGRKLATLEWGQGARQVGLAQAEQGLTRGPEALAVAPDGRIAVLDSVNSRLVLLASNGDSLGTIKLGLAEPRFLAVDNASLYVLDADTDHRIIHCDWKGDALEEGSMPSVDDVVTGLFVTADGPCIEVAHADTFLVDMKDVAAESAVAGQSGRSGKPAAATLRSLAGRPVDRDLGKAAKVTFSPKEGVTLKRFNVDKKTLRGSQTQAAAAKFASGRSIEHLVSVDGDGRGGLIIGARLIRAKGDSAESPSLVIGHIAAESKGDMGTLTLTDTLTLSDSSFAYVGQPYVVAPDGRVFQPVGTEQGYSIVVYSLPNASDPPKEVQQ